MFFFFVVFKNCLLFIFKVIDCYLYLIIYDVRDFFIIGECDVKFGDYFVGNVLFFNYSYYKR